MKCEMRTTLNHYLLDWNESGVPGIYSYFNRTPLLYVIVIALNLVLLIYFEEMYEYIVVVNEIYFWNTSA